MAQNQAKPISISDSDLEYIILDLFIELNIGSGRYLDLLSLQQHWQETGLRQSDLHRGLDCLLRKSSLEPIERNGQFFFMLTPTGEQFANPELNFSSVQKHLHANRMLRRSRARRYQQKQQPPEAIPDHERRQNVLLPGFDQSDTINLTDMGVTELLEEITSEAS